MASLARHTCDINQPRSPPRYNESPQRVNRRSPAKRHVLVKVEDPHTEDLEEGKSSRSVWLDRILLNSYKLFDMCLMLCNDERLV